MVQNIAEAAARFRSQLRNVQHIQETAAFLESGITWGGSEYGGDSSQVQEPAEERPAHPRNCRLS